jgi:ribose-phosphate pyrophosphokinase
LPEEKRIDKIKILPTAPVFAKAIERIYEDRPISTLFN